MIEDSESDLFAVKSYAEDAAKGNLKGCSVALLHGKMRSAEKDKVMKNSTTAKYRCLSVLPLWK
jgi:ATP-dependent DNA helicase RecG